jgi:hypothetical protein
MACVRKLTAFAMRTETINGFRHGFGAGDSANRSDGVMLTTQPLTTRPERLQVSALYLNAEGNPLGSSTAGYPESVRNDAAALAVDSLTFDQRVRLRGEYARSDTDFDGAGTLVGDESDSAHSLLAQYQHPQRELRGDAFVLERRRRALRSGALVLQPRQSRAAGRQAPRPGLQWSLPGAACR